MSVVDGAKAVINLPSNIAPGNYLIRHEIIALHLGTERGGAEFYPSCAQLKIGGNGNGAPAPNELVSLPGAYSDDDPGIFDPDVRFCHVSWQMSLSHHCSLLGLQPQCEVCISRTSHRCFCQRSFTSTLRRIITQFDGLQRFSIIYFCRP